MLCTLSQAVQAAEVGDPLQRPAVASERAATSMMTAITRAGDRLVAVGERGIVLLSTDGGQRWTQARVPVSTLLTGVRFATPRRGWAVGHSGVVLATQDGGMTWAVQLDGTRAAQLLQASAMQAIGSDTLVGRLRAETERLVREGADKPFFDVDVENEQVLTVIGAFGLALRSEDGGASWHAWSQPVLSPAGKHLYGLGRKGGTAVVVGEQGMVCRSGDAVEGCVLKAVPAKTSHFGVVVLSEQHWLVYGLRGKAFLSEDGGESWQNVGIDESASLTAGLRRRDGAIVLASQAGTLFISTDGGHGFRKLTVRNPVPIIGIAEAPDGTLVAAGLRGVARIDVAAN